MCNGTHQKLAQLISVIGVFDQVQPSDWAGVHQLRGDEHRGGGHQLQGTVVIVLNPSDDGITNLELILLDVDLAEEPVHHVAGQEKDVGVTVLIQTNLKRSPLSINLKYFISTRAVKLEQINLLLWATLSLDFIRAVIKELQ